MTNLIGINGKIGSGKDTVAQIIQYLCSGETAHFLAWRNAQLYIGPDPKYQGGWEIKKFAAKLKQICAILTGIPVEDFEKQEVKNSVLGDEWAHSLTDAPMVVRTLLQRVGTEAMREQIHPQVWVNALFADYIPEYQYPQYGGFEDKSRPEGSFPIFPFPKWIISDMRFPNEMEAIKQRGGITLLVKRPGTDVGSTHPSETALDNVPFNYKIDNSGTIENLVEDVRDILKTEKII